MICLRTQEKSNKVEGKKAVYRILIDKTGKGGGISTIKSITVHVKDLKYCNSIFKF